MLVDHFLTNICAEYGIAKKPIADEALDLLKNYNWTGNIRELRNIVERMVILSGKAITEQDVRSNVMMGVSA
ncbi:MAG TPA: hypothetical protein PKD90_05950 [Phnomibacter sp.]|nr:hypothetical protein [Phnomibacter sp.]